MSQTLKLYIPKVLSENKIVLLKGIGTLRMSYRTAQPDNDLAVMSAPREEIYFVPGDEGELDPILIKVVEMIARVDEDEAIELVRQFMVDLRMELRGNGFLTFPNIGWIKQDNWGSLFFEPAAEYIAINRFFGLGQVSLPEPLPIAERKALDDLKETVSEQSEEARSLQQKQPERVWGFIIGVLLILITLTTAFFMTDRSGNDADGIFAEASADSAGQMQPEKKVNEAPPLLTDLSEPEADTSHRQVVESGLVDDTVERSSDTDTRVPVSVGVPTSDCVVIVGAFADDDNVQRMVDRIDRSDRQSVVISGSALTKVGVKVDCNEGSDSTLRWARREIDSEAWVLKI